MKRLLILITLLFLTGCTAQYTIDFNDDTVTEELLFTSANGVEYNAIKNGEFAPIPSFRGSAMNLEEPVKNEGIEYYDIDARNNNIRLKYDFKLSDYENSYIGNLCYNYFKVFEEDDEIVISTGNKFDCFYTGYDINNIDVVITSNHEVLFNNADEVKDNKYIWHISKNTEDDESIQISFSKETKTTVFDKKSVKITLILAGIAAMILIFSLIIYIRYKRINKI